jgi:hypothetical protein
MMTTPLTTLTTVTKTATTATATTKGQGKSKTTKRKAQKMPDASFGPYVRVFLLFIVLFNTN